MGNIKRTKAEQQIYEATWVLMCWALFVGILIGLVAGALIWA